MTIGEKLRTLRGEKSIAEVAKAVDITPSALSNYEHDLRVPRDEIKKKIASYYKRSVTTIFFGE